MAKIEETTVVEFSFIHEPMRWERDGIVHEALGAETQIGADKGRRFWTWCELSIDNEDEIKEEVMPITCPLCSEWQKTWP